MARVTLAALKVGMTVRADIVDRAGRLLVPTGTQLEDKHLRRLQIWGITDVEVEAPARDGDGDSDPESSSHLSEADEERIRDRFRHNDLDHPLIRELLTQAFLRAARGSHRKSRK